MRGDAEAAPRRRFELVRFDDLRASPGRSYLVRGLIPRDGLVVAWGPPKCGKTFFVFDLAMHIALGWQYRGRRTMQGTVVYIACEGERGLSARAEAFRRDKMCENPAPTPFFLLTTRLDLAADHSTLIDDVRAQLGAQSCVAVIIDTLNRSLRGSESVDADMAAYIDGAAALREAFDCAIIIIHHCGLDDKRPRGHTSLSGAVDAQIAVRRDANDAIIASVEYMKDGEAGAEIASALRVVELDPDEDGEPVTSCVVDPAESGAASPRKPKKINAAAQQALALLHECMAAGATDAPASTHIPGGTRGVTKKAWQSYCEKGGIINADGSPRQELKRIIVGLKDAGSIGIWGDFVWPTKNG
jgi:hypothetical protein